MNHDIQLFIHDSFFDSFSSLPKHIQKQTRELLKKFRENPTSSAINYEKISSFADQSLRTVRVTDKYRAIVQAPEKGKGYHLLWVDNHDEAMDWAKNKIFKWNLETQGFQLFEQPPEPVIKETITPKVSLFNGLTDAELLLIGTPEQMINLVRSISSVDDLSNSKKNLPADLYEYLFYIAEGITLEEILEDINAGKAAENPMESSNALKHAFILTDDAQLEEVLNGSFEKWKIFLHPSQRTLAYRNFNGPVKVTGGAGTGKTVCALHRAKFLNDNSGIFDQPILFTTYTKSLTGYLQDTIKSLGVSEKQVEIINIDKLISDLANDPKYLIFDTWVGYFSAEQEKSIWRQSLEKYPSQFDVDFFFSEYNDIILPQNISTLEEYNTASRIGRNSRIGKKDKIDIWTIVEEFKKQKEGNYSKLELCNILAAYFRNQKQKPYSYLICDEIQDFSNPELSLLRALVEERENDMFLVGDPYQNIYKKTLNFAKSGVLVKGRRSRKLKINYRTTEEIKHLAMEVVTDLKVDDFDGNQESLKGYLSLMHGNEPVYQTFVTPEKEDEFILNKLNFYIASGEIQPSEICVCTRTNHALDDLKKSLNSSNIKYQDLSSNKQNNNSIIVSTFHNMKGHEFKIVFVKGTSETTVPYKFVGYLDLSSREKDAYDQQERSLYYVVFSRAIQSVLITGVGEKSNWFNN